MSSFRHIPAIDELLLQARIMRLLEIYRRDYIVAILQDTVAESRKRLRHTDQEVTKEEIITVILDHVESKASKQARGTLQRVMNGTGVVLHTNLGRAPLGNRALRHLNEMAIGYNNLEMNLEKGERGSRYQHVESLLTRLTGAEAGLVVNNNAASVLLALTTLARGKEVIVSRGQLVEIGGAFRIPDVMRQSNATLVEVGTTNKTYISDFADAINEQTALLFSAHTSNYKILGFTQEVKIDELVKLGEETCLPVVLDLGSGILTDLGEWGLREEPTVQECVAAGADLITFSGDKLLGGPQAGIIVGKKCYIEAMKKNQLTRALRVDKLIIAALEGTLVEYLCGYPQKDIPVVEMLTRSNEVLKQQADSLTLLLTKRFQNYKQVKQIHAKILFDKVGGGAYPTYDIPGHGVEIEFSGISLEAVSDKLRKMNPALLTRKQDNRMQISVRTLLEGDYVVLVEQMDRAIQAEKEGRNF